MKITKGYKYRIYPNDVQTEQISRTLGCCRFVYNHFLALRSEAWKECRESLSYVATARLLTELKRDPEHLWLASADSMALQESLRNLDRAYRNFFSGRGRYPRYKSKHDHCQSYRTRNQSDNIRIEDGRIVLPKLGAVKARISRIPDGRILNASVSPYSDRQVLRIALRRGRARPQAKLRRCDRHRRGHKGILHRQQR